MSGSGNSSQRKTLTKLARTPHVLAETDEATSPLPLKRTRRPSETTTMSAGRDSSGGNPGQRRKANAGSKGHEQQTDGEDFHQCRYCGEYHGSWIFCEDPKCNYIWFGMDDLNCIGFTEAPPGKWICPPCKIRKDDAKSSSAKETSQSSSSRGTKGKKSPNESSSSKGVARKKYATESSSSSKRVATIKDTSKSSSSSSRGAAKGRIAPEESSSSKGVATKKDASKSSLSSSDNATKEKNAPEESSSSSKGAATTKDAPKSSSSTSKGVAVKKDTSSTGKPGWKGYSGKEEVDTAWKFQVNTSLGKTRRQSRPAEYNGPQAAGRRMTRAAKVSSLRQVQVEEEVEAEDDDGAELEPEQAEEELEKGQAEGEEEQGPAEGEEEQGPAEGEEEQGPVEGEEDAATGAETPEVGGGTAQEGLSQHSDTTTEDGLTRKLEFMLGKKLPLSESLVDPNDDRTTTEENTEAVDEEDSGSRLASESIPDPFESFPDAGEAQDKMEDDGEPRNMLDDDYTDPFESFPNAEGLQTMEHDEGGPKDMPDHDTDAEGYRNMKDDENLDEAENVMDDDITASEELFAWREYHQAGNHDQTPEENPTHRDNYVSVLPEDVDDLGINQRSLNVAGASSEFGGSSRWGAATDFSELSDSEMADGIDEMAEGEESDGSTIRAASGEEEDEHQSSQASDEMDIDADGEDIMDNGEVAEDLASSRTPTSERSEGTLDTDLEMLDGFLPDLGMPNYLRLLEYGPYAARRI